MASRTEEFFLKMRYFCKRLQHLKRTLTCILLPLLLCPIPLAIGTTEAACAYVVLIMAYFWVTETLPLAVTALIPTFAYPLLCIETAEDVSKEYLKDSNMVFFGSMIMAVCVESSLLHERIALRTLMFTGSNPRWLLMGFEIATAFISMWISNSATTTMMVPILVAVIRELDLCQRRQIDPEATYHPTDNEEIIDVENVPKQQLKVYKALMLSICFASSVGGTATLIGTGANVVFNSYLHDYYKDNSPVSFASFMFYALPQAIILLIVLWVWFQIIFIGFNWKQDKEYDRAIKQLLEKKYKLLGPLRYEEKTILVMFGVFIFLLLSRHPVFIPGWGALFPPKYVTDGTVAMFVSLMMFVLPAENPMEPETVEDLEPGEHIRRVMDWKLMREKFSWSTLFLLGGGYAMASGVKNSGLSEWVGAQMISIEDLPEWAFIAICCAVVTFLTEFTSNVATASIFIPIVTTIAKMKKTDPLIYVLPVTFSASFAFMFPSGTPPNAIVFGLKIVKVWDMVWGGLMMNIVSYILCQVLSHTFASVIFNFGNVNAVVNGTTSAPC